ncbi:MAG: hypothetical protein IJ064_05870 [Bacteroidaceae bacterium]|nr:hypothetical protein [Bacteroidaceae bacterium]
MIIKIAPEGANTTKRFFMALEFLQRQRKIRGLRTFTEKYGINYWNFYTLKSEPESRVMKVEYLTYLVRDFGVSAEWLLLGSGPMMKNEPKNEDSIK